MIGRLIDRFWREKLSHPTQWTNSLSSWHNNEFYSIPISCQLRTLVREGTTYCQKNHLFRTIHSSLLLGLFRFFVANLYHSLQRHTLHYYNLEKYEDIERTNEKSTWQVSANYHKDKHLWQPQKNRKLWITITAHMLKGYST